MIKIKRLTAIIIDYIVYYVFISLIVQFLMTFFKIENQFSIILFSIFMIILCFILFVTKDLIIFNKSIGKKIMKISICDESKKEITDKKILIKRNAITLFTLPTYPIMIIFKNENFGDYVCKTLVI